MTNQPLHTRQEHQQNPGEIPLEQITLPVGDLIQLQIGNAQHTVTLVGYLKEQSVVVTLPHENGNPLHIDKGVPVTARFSVDGNHYTFDTIVFGISGEPFPYLYLACPEGVRPLKERQYQRIAVNLAGTAEAPEGASLSCVVRDISIGGALIALDTQTGGINDSLLLTLRVNINGTEYELVLDSQIRSVRTSEGSIGGDRILQGLAFDNLSEPDVLALAAFDLLPNLNAST